MRRLPAQFAALAFAGVLAACTPTPPSGSTPQATEEPLEAVFAAAPDIAPRAGSDDRPLILVGGTVIDGTGAPPLDDAVIVIEDGRIAAFGSRGEVAIPQNGQVVDLAGKWVLPGLIDAHVHLAASAGLYTRPEALDLTAFRPLREERRRGRTRLPATLARYLASGVTTVVDMGGPDWLFAVRALAEKQVSAPRVAVVGPLIGVYTPPEREGVARSHRAVRTETEARAVLAEVIARGPDLIKIWLDAPRGFSGPVPPTYYDDWLPAAVDEVHAAGLDVAVHAFHRVTARAAVDAGADALVHSVMDRPIDGAFVAALKRQDVVYIPTLTVLDGYVRVLEGRPDLLPIEAEAGDPEAIASWKDLDTLSQEDLPDWIFRRPVAPDWPAMHVNLGRVHAAGVTLAAGSDAGNIGTLHGPAIHRELAAMVDAGIPPMAALAAATRGGAAVLGREDEFGTVAVGKHADLLVLDADPLADIANTRHIYRVVRAGRMFDPEGILAALADD